MPRAQAALLLALLAACSGGGRRAGGDTGAGAGDGSGRRAHAHPVVIPSDPAPAYQAVHVADGGTVSGTVHFTGTLPADTVVHPTRDQDVCGTSLTDHTIDHTGDALGGVIVWLTDIRTGKALPIDRRFEVLNEQCVLDPRVQGVLAGGTLDVRSLDPVVHRTRIVRWATDSVMSLVTENDEGQVVPVETVLRHPGLLELTCDFHPWTRAFVAVFDHPYFQTTGTDGTFSLDSVPPGHYHIAAWHERFGKVEGTVTVRAGQTSNVTLTLRGK